MVIRTKNLDIVNHRPVACCLRLAKGEPERAAADIWPRSELLRPHMT